MDRASAICIEREELFIFTATQTVSYYYQYKVILLNFTVSLSFKVQRTHGY